MTPPPAPHARRRRLIVLIAAIVALFALYLTVVVMYGLSGDVDSSGTEDEPFGTDDLVLALTPTEMDAQNNRLSIRIEPLLEPRPYSDDGLTPSETLHLIVTGTDGPRSIEYPAGDVAAPVSVALIADGYIERWPFDGYTAASVIVPVRTGPDGVDEPVPYRLVAQGRVPGWAIAAQAEVVHKVRTGQGEVEILSVDFTVHRSGSTIAFGIVLLTLMVVTPVLVLTAAFTVLRGRRKIEVTMLDWIGAMLFATIPLRNFLSGSPPIGSWIDYLIVLWVIAGLVAGLVVFVIAWLRDGPPGVAVSADAGSAVSDSVVSGGDAATEQAADS